MGPLSVEEQVGPLAERGTKNQFGHREAGGLSEDASDLLGGIALATNIGGNDVEGTGLAAVSESELIAPNRILEVHPRKPLAPIAERATEKHAEGSDEQAKRSRLARYHERGAHEHDTSAVFGRTSRLVFPLDANPREKRRAGARPFRHGFIGAVTRVVDAGRVDEHAGPRQ